MAFDSTISGSGSNSYITVAQADDYFSLRYESSLWDSITAPATKEKLSVSATRRIDAEKYFGFKTAISQALQFPRESIYDRDGLAYDANEIPRNLISAVCEMIYFILNQDERLLGDSLLHDAENLSGFSGSIDGMGFNLSIRADAKANKLPQEVITELVAMGGVWKKSKRTTILKR